MSVLRSRIVTLATCFLVSGCAAGPVGDASEDVCLDFYRLQADGLSALLSEEVNGAAIWDLSLRSMSEMAADVGDAELIGAFADLRTAGEALQEGDPDADIFGAMRKVQFACKNLLDDEDAAAIAE